MTETISEQDIAFLRRKAILNQLRRPYSNIKNSDLNNDSIIELASKIAKHIGVISNVDLTIEAIATPGEMSKSANGKFHIRIHPNVIGRSNAEIYVIAHEYAHVLLCERGISETNTITNEILTDLQCIYLGFGADMRNSIHLDSMSADTIKRKNYGYLTQKQVCGELARFAVLTSSKEQFLSDKLVSKRILILQNQLKLSPTWVLRKWTASQILAGFTMNLDYACPICEQKCRVPMLKKKIKINCPTCKISFNR